jgi:O-antigen ligase
MKAIHYHHGMAALIAVFFPLLIIYPHATIVILGLMAITATQSSNQFNDLLKNSIHELKKNLNSTTLIPIITGCLLIVYNAPSILLLKMSVSALIAFILFIYGRHTHHSALYWKSFAAGMWTAFSFIDINDYFGHFFEHWTHRSNAKAFVPLSLALGCLFIPYFFGIRYRLKIMTIAGRIASLFLLLTMMTIDSDTQWLCFIFGALFLFIRYQWPFLTQKLYQFGIILGLILPLGSFLLTSSLIEKANHILPKVSYIHRLHIAMDCANTIMEKPILGHGIGSTSKALHSPNWTFYNANHEPRLIMDKSLHTHNIVLQILVEMGGVGFLLLGWIIINIMNRINRIHDPYIQFFHYNLLMNILIISSIATNMWQTWWISTIIFSVFLTRQYPILETHAMKPFLKNNFKL